jgi:aminoglycoside 6-adenylyltransferase
MNTTKDTVKRMMGWAKENENVRIVMLTSSRANPNAEVDALSDYDIELYVKQLEPFLESDEWLEGFGAVLVRWPYEPPDNKDRTTRLVLYEDGPRIDFQIKGVQTLAEVATAPRLPDSHDMGYQVLLDKDGMTKGIKPPTYTAYRTKAPTKSEYEALVHDFWWDITYVAKYLFRDQLFFAKYMLDDSLHHHYLKTAISWYIGAQNGWQSNPGTYGRWFKKQLEPEVWSDIEGTFAASDLAENWNAMFKAAEVFGMLASKVGEHLGYAYPFELGRNVTDYLSELRRTADSPAGNFR